MFLCPLFGLSVIVPGWFLTFSAGQRRAFTATLLADVAGRWWGHLPTVCSFRSCLPFFAHDGRYGTSTTFGDADFGVVGIVLGHIIAMFN
jgi:PTS system ascorbate-specific IIC component